MSHHIGDTNEMSDTPISDSTPHNVAELGMLCRRLERQLNEANARIKQLEEAYSATEAVRTIRDCWCNHDPDTWTRCSTCSDKIKRYHAAKANLNRTEEAKEAKL